MSIIFVAAIIIGSLMVVSFLLVSVEKKQRRNAVNKLLHRFSELGSKYNLTFSSQELLQGAVIGLDGVRRKLLVLNQSTPEHFIIELNETKTCLVKKYYRSIQLNDMQNRGSDQVLEKLVLRFEFQTTKQAIEIPFYRHIVNPVFQLQELEQKANYWEAILSKLIGSQEKKIA